MIGKINCHRYSGSEYYQKCSGGRRWSRRRRRQSGRRWVEAEWRKCRGQGQCDVAVGQRKEREEGLGEKGNLIF